MVLTFISTTQSFAYQTVYGFDLGQTGLTSLAPLLGCLLAVPTCGVLNDFWISRQRKRLGLSFEPETRLAFMIIPCFLGTVGMIVFGTCVQAQHNGLRP